MVDLTIHQATRQAIEHLRGGRMREAEALVRQVLQQAPAYAPALQCLGLIAQRAGRQQDSADLIGRAIAADPSPPEYHYNLAASLQAMGRVGEAEASLRQAIRLKGDLAPAHLNLGVLLFNLARLDEAIACFRESIRLRPADPWAYLNLGRALRTQDKLDEAESAFRQAIRLAPNLSPAYNMLGSLLREQGRVREMIDTYRTSVRLDPGAREPHCNLCYGLYFDPQATPDQILDQHLEWSRRFAEPLHTLHRPHENDRTPDRKLRIGYVSPNLRYHVVGFFMEPVLQGHDKEQFQVFCYSDAPPADELAHRLRGYAHAWRETAGLTDQRLADLVRDDRIDILVDLNLHMKGCRLGVFARKPAPVQITFLGYCGTTGLKTIDWCITDPHMLLPGREKYFTEKMLPLPDCYWCYRPSPTAPPVGPLPMRAGGHVTFGSLNTLAKVNDQVIRLWSRLLDAVAGSRLAVHVPGGPSSRGVLNHFTAHGIAPDRLDALPRQNRDAYLDLYNRIDIALDPFPYNGGTTTFDALWMGVPVVTLAGDLPLARAGVTILTNLGLTELIAQSQEQYVKIAADLARCPDRLAGVRASLRQRLRESVFMDAECYVRNLERAYLHAWRGWGEGTTFTSDG